MSEQPRVCAAVVTYNRKDLLRGCLKSLLEQTRVLDQIVVIDNHSSDGTLEMLRSEFANGVPGKVPFTIVPLEENRGGAGGFATGLDWAHRNGFDWIWVMDDDIEILPGALAMMLAHQDVSDFIHCRRLAPGFEVILDCMWDLTACSAFNPRAPIMHKDDNGRPWIAVQWGNFEGALIHRSVIDRIGLPDERFFIAGDDSMYGLEASFRTNVIYVKEYGVQRMLPKPARTSRMGFYLLLRNRFLVREHLVKLGFDVHPLMFWCSQLMGLFWVVRFVLGDSTETKKREMMAAALNGLIDGAKGRFGRPPFIKA
jgi:rhamnopyranosyl-N-acetylglucosaminyl-diphospho-decaprenol beta-1,3/1,4-galactofuranosyltransferase